MYHDRYKVLSKLGWGHFSTVWKCLDLDTGYPVAMKVHKSAATYTGTMSEAVSSPMLMQLASVLCITTAVVTTVIANYRSCYG